jgi:hypothetical protein
MSECLERLSDRRYLSSPRLILQFYEPDNWPLSLCLRAPAGHDQNPLNWVLSTLIILSAVCPIEYAKCQWWTTVETVEVPGTAAWPR